ncbi:MAG: hypothetical protein ABIF12_01980 [bacterium]
MIFRFKKVLKNILPYGLVKLYRFFYRQLYAKKKFKSMVGKDYQFILDKNKIFKDFHKNERCFIVGTGPSITNQDMMLLKGENSIFLSQFYLHDQYEYINPKYHLISGVAIHSDISYQTGLNWYKQIEEGISTDTILFINYLDRDFIIKNSLLKKHKIYYFAFQKLLQDIFNLGINASDLLYGVDGIPIMGIQIALYMGFKEIYLLGIDFSINKKTGKTHFYELDRSLIDGYGVDPKNVEECAKYKQESYRAVAKLLDQFEIIDRYAKSIDCKIKNATNYSELSVFERVKFENLF